MADTRALDRIPLELFPAIGRNHISEFFFDSASVEKEAKSDYDFSELLDHRFDIYDCVPDQIDGMHPVLFRELNRVCAEKLETFIAHCLHYHRFWTLV